MATITASVFAALDGAVDPGVGNWHFPYFNEEMGQAVDATHDADVMLFGRVTYDSFAGAWPEREAAGGEDAAFAKRLGVPDDAKHQCAEMPCSLKQAHETMTFTFRTGKPGRFRWQCFVPCAAGFIDGFAGPMQTIGYMDGFIHVV